MVAGLRRRAAQAGVLHRFDLLMARPDALGVAHLAGQVDLVLAFAVVHELPDAARFFAEVGPTLKADGRVLVAEPAGHVGPAAFEASLGAAARAGLQAVRAPGAPHIARSLTALLARAFSRGRAKRRWGRPRRAILPG
jgi:SAM-dependent methyltransferase